LVGLGAVEMTIHAHLLDFTTYIGQYQRVPQNENLQIIRRGRERGRRESKGKADGKGDGEGDGDKGVHQ